MNPVISRSSSEAPPSFVKKTVQPVMQGVSHIASGANAVKNDADAFVLVLKVANYFFTGLQAIFKNVKVFATTIFHLASSISVLEFFGDTIGTAFYIVSGAFIQDIKDKRFCSFLGSMTLGAAGVAGAIAWLAELGFFSLGVIATGIGGVGLAPIICIAVAVGYGFLAGDAIQTLVSSQKKEERVKAWIDLASRIANAALFVFLSTSLIVAAVATPIAPVVSVPIIVGLGLIAAGLGLTSFLYKHYNQKAFN